MNVVFDVDGTIIDTREQVREAYARAGVTQPPETFHMPWEQWLPDITGGMFQACRIHKRKNQIYRKILEEMPPKLLPPARVLEHRVRMGWSTYMISSGSEDAIYGALAVVNLSYVPLLGCELTAEQKNMLFTEKFNSSGVYVDDNPNFELTAPGWRFIHYYGQPRLALHEQIQMVDPNVWKEER